MNINKYSVSTYTLALFLVLIDIVGLYTSLKLSLYIRFDVLTLQLPYSHITDINQYYWIILIILFMFMFEKIYFTRYDFWGDTRKVLTGLFFSFLTVFTVITLTKISYEYSRAFIVVFFVVSALLLPTFKRVFKNILFYFDFFKINIKIVANGNQYDDVSNEIDKNWYLGFKKCENDYDMVIISSKNFDIDLLQETIDRYKQETKDIYLIPYIDYLDLSRSNIIDYSNIRLSAIHIENKLLNYKNIILKYVFEKFILILILPVAFVIHILIFVLIKLDSKGDVIFIQKRLGKNSQEFNCYKYRTMHVKNQQEILDKYLKKNPSEITYYAIYHKYEKDPRVTKIGKFLRKTSLDEFPQFYNILLGNMNLIGPRPYMISEKEKIGALNEELILKVSPGITGLWQVSGRNELTFNQRIALDRWYIQNWSLWIDFVIFMKTIKVVLFKIGAK